VKSWQTTFKLVCQAHSFAVSLALVNMWLFPDQDKFSFGQISVGFQILVEFSNVTESDNALIFCTLPISSSQYEY